MLNDWRITNQQTYMTNVSLVRRVFHGKDVNSHEHCEFCFVRFSDFSEDLKEGYCTLDGYHWICEQCFDDFKSLFGWKIDTKLLNDVNPK